MERESQGQIPRLLAVPWDAPPECQLQEGRGLGLCTDVSQVPKQCLAQSRCSISVE